MVFIMILGLLAIVYIVPLLFKKATIENSKQKRYELTRRLNKLDIIIFVSLTLLTFWILFSIKIFGFIGLFVATLVGLLSLLLYAPLMIKAGIKFRQRPIRCIASIFTYLFLGIGAIPLLNYLIVFQSLNPIFGFERKIISSNNKYLFERQHSVVTSGGRYVYVLYERSLLYDRVKHEYYGLESEFESQKFINSIR